ncbi:MAG TPA: ATP-binding protein [Planctomycetota bacterium]|nr:ATP-binding protein [Planctomycetota bacterium]
MPVPPQKKASGTSLTMDDSTLRQAADTAPVMSWVSGPAKLSTYFNQAWLQFTGRSLEDELGNGWLAGVHPDDVKGCVETYSASFEAKRASLREFRLRRWDGVYRSILDMAAPRFLLDGTFMGYIGACMDLTDCQRAARSLDGSLHRYETLVESIDGIVWEADADTLQFLFVSPQAQRLLGYPVEEWMSVPDFWVKHLHSEDRERCVEFCRMRTSEMRDHSIDYRMLAADGRVVWLRNVVTAVAENGRPSRICGVMLDITERMTVESQVQAAHRHAVDTSQLKTGFLSTVSHEIRTPMNVIMGMTGLMLETKLDKEQREYAQAVWSSADGLLTIINDILDFAKLESDTVEIQKIDFDLRSLVEDATVLSAQAAQVKGLEMACLIHPRVPTALRGDAGRLRQILKSLLSNAVKFTLAGEVVVDVSVTNETPADARVRIEVRDTGIGVPREALPRVFKAFSQVDASMSRKYDGMGLGLAIAKSLTDLMGGQIGVESEPGKGSTFWFAARFEKQPEIAETLDLPAQSLQGLAALIVDDNASQRRMLRLHLEEWGLRVDEADEGNHALEVLRSGGSRKKPHDLVILDRQMPGMDGFELARKIRAEPSLAQPALVMLASTGFRGDAARARLEGLSAYLTKPLREARLRACLLTVMGRFARRAASGEAALPSLITSYTLKEAAHKSSPRVLVAERQILNQRTVVGQLSTLGYRVDVVGSVAEIPAALALKTYAAILLSSSLRGFEALASMREAQSGEGAAPRVPMIALLTGSTDEERDRCLQAGVDAFVSAPWKTEDLAEILTLCSPVPAARLEGGDVPVLDPDTMAELYEVQGEGDPNFLKDLFETFLESASERLQAIRRAFDERNVGDLTSAAHAFKSSCAYLGALKLAGICAQLETQGKAGSLDKAQDQITAAEAEYERVRQAIEAELQGVN